jgi:hypothetical protein
MENTPNDQSPQGTCKGDYSVKHHLFNGPKTMCNKKSLHTHEKASFVGVAKNYPEICCQFCLKYVKQRGLL